MEYINDNDSHKCPEIYIRRSKMSNGQSFKDTINLNLKCLCWPTVNVLIYCTSKSQETLLL